MRSDGFLQFDQFSELLHERRTEYGSDHDYDKRNGDDKFFVLCVDMETKRKGDDSSNDAGIPTDLELLGREDEFFVEEAVEQG